MEQKTTTARQQALKDISAWIKTEHPNLLNSSGDLWIITPSRIDNPKQRKLNRDLGIHKVNYIKTGVSEFNKA